MAAVIQKAVEDMKINLDEYDSKKRPEMERIQKGAKEWLLSTSDKLMSFEWYCSYLNIDPGKIRKAIKINER